MKYSAFTLTEILLAMSLIITVSIAGVVSYRSFQSINESETVAFTVVKSLRHAQTLSQAVSGDSDWGVFVQSDRTTVFKGNSYATRDTAEDIDYVFVNDASVSGVAQIVYTKFTGIPQTTGSITLTVFDISKVITINAKGTINY